MDIDHSIISKMLYSRSKLKSDFSKLNDDREPSF